MKANKYRILLIYMLLKIGFSPNYELLFIMCYHFELHQPYCSQKVTIFSSFFFWKLTVIAGNDPF